MFKYSEGQVLLQFGKGVSVVSAVHTEVLALKEGLQVAVASRWAYSHSFVFESDYKSIIAWVVDPASAL